MSHATVPPLVENAPSEGEAPPATPQPQPAPAPVRRLNDAGASLIPLTIGAAIAAAVTIRVAVPELRDLVVFGGLGVLLVVALIGLVVGRLR